MFDVVFGYACVCATLAVKDAIQIVQTPNNCTLKYGLFQGNPFVTKYENVAANAKSHDTSSTRQLCFRASTVPEKIAACGILTVAAVGIVTIRPFLQLKITTVADEK
jgi:hypothetical protein